LQPTAIAFSIPGKNSATCNFTLQIGQEVPQVNPAKTLISLSCNIHFELRSLPDKVRGISNILQGWKTHQDFLEAALEKYLEEDLT